MFSCRLTLDADWEVWVIIAKLQRISRRLRANVKIFGPHTVTLAEKYIWWSDATVICSHNTISVLWATQRKVSGKDLLRYRIKLNQFLKENVRIITILLRKWCHNNKHFAEPASRHGGKTGEIDMIWRNYVTVTLCIHAVTDERIVYCHGCMISLVHGLVLFPLR